MKNIVLVDKHNHARGILSKTEVHRRGLLHRAFSIFLVNSKGEILLQQRAKNKYHSGGLWANSCCSHPAPGERLLAAARRRLQEELGIVCRLIPAFNFIYSTSVGNGLIENEYDTVLVGGYTGPVQLDRREIMATRWASLTKLQADARKQPKHYAPWLRIILNKHFVKLKKYLKQI